MSDPFQQIVGEQLSAVTFVADYVQLHFNGQRLSALTAVTVTSAEGRAKSGDERFRNLLCSCIGKEISAVEYTESEALLINIVDGSIISLTLREDDYHGPEAINFHGAKNEIVVI